MQITKIENEVCFSIAWNIIKKEKMNSRFSFKSLNLFFCITLSKGLFLYGVNK